MTSKYAAILMGRQHEESTDVGLESNSVVFGSVGKMSSAIEQYDDVRKIAIYPCIGAGEAGTGLLLLLGHLLASAERVKLYPVLLRVGEDGGIDNSPFSPDEWVLADLNDDTAIWATLTQNDGHEWTLRVTVEDDSFEGLLLTFEKTASQWLDLFNNIIDLADEIAERLSLQRQLPYPVKLTTAMADEDVKEFSAALFTFHHNLLNAALTDTFLADSILSDPLIQAANRVTHPLIAWGIGAALGYETVLRDQLGLLSDNGVYQSYPEALSGWQDGVAIFSVVVMNNDLADPQASSALTAWCLEQLESAVERFPAITLNWVVLSIFYNKLRRPDLAVDVCQRALEADIRQESVYFAYTDALSAMIEAGFKIERLILNKISIITPDEESIRLERVLSLELGLANHPKPDCERLSQYVIEAAKHDKMSEVQQAFERLSINDGEGKFTEIVIQKLSHIEDLNWMLILLEKAAEQGNFQSWINLAKATLLTGDVDRCKVATQNALAAARQTQQRADAQLILIELEVSALQADFADIIGRLQQEGGEVFESDLEFLEYLVENAPDYAEGYLALSLAYQRADEPNTALEVLLDAERVTKGTPEIYLALAQLFEQEDELTLSIENIRKGLDLAPANVSLLAQAALLAHLSDDDAGAQAFLRRAHAITPYHPRIVAVTRRIQQSDSDQDDE